MAIKFVDSTATGSNDGTSWTNAYTSLNTAISAANHAPGDQYLVSGTFNETVTIAEAATLGSTTIIQGDDKSGGAGVGVAADFTIDGQSTRTNCLDTSLGAGTNTYYCFKNMICTGATADGAELGNLRHITFKDCDFHNNGGYGYDGNNSGHSFERCSFYSNTSVGCRAGVSGSYVFCKFYSNGGVGCVPNGGLLYCCLFYNNTGIDIQDGSTAGAIYIVNCTIDGDGKTSNGIVFANSHRGHTLLNTIVDNVDGIGGVAIDGGSSDLGEVAISSYNCVSNNTTNYNNAATFTGEQTTSPGFTNQASDDYTLDGTGSANGAGGDASS